MKSKNLIAHVTILIIILMMIQPAAVLGSSTVADTVGIKHELLAKTGFVAASNDSGAASWTLMVMHTNDTHSHLGTIARRATLINKLRAETANSLLLDAGDFTTGDLYFNKYQGVADIDMLNRLGYDAVTTGNHEYDKGPAKLADLLQYAGFPVLNANFDYNFEPALFGKFSDAIAEQGKDNLRGRIFPAVILDVNGEKVGVLGLTTPDTKEASSPGPNIKENDYLAAADRTVKSLGQQGINKIIAVTHLGWDEDLKLARQVEGIDLIVGGHTHTVANPYPSVVDPDNTPTLVVQAGSNANLVGQVNITFDNNGIVLAAQSEGKLINVNEQDVNKNYVYSEDQSIKAILDVYDQPLNEVRSQKIGESNVYLNGTLVRSRETNLGNMVADAMLEKSAAYGTTASICNGGGIRTSVGPGGISMGQALTILPFGNTLAVVEITGQQLLAALENGVSQVEKLGGRFPQVAGMRYSFDLHQPVGKRVSEVAMKSAAGYQALDLQGYYKVATISYMAGGGDGYSVLQEARNIYYPGFVDVDILAEYLAQHSPVKPQLENRINPIYTDSSGTVWQEWMATEWPSPQQVSPDKTWTVRFNQQIDQQYISPNIYVTDDAGNRLNTKANLQVDNKTVIISPPPELYQKGRTYTLNITGVKSGQGMQLLKPVRNVFAIPN